MLREIDIQPNDRVVFVHIPKTAGETFSHIIDPLLSGFLRWPKKLTEKLWQFKYEEIAPYQLFMGHCAYQVFESFFHTEFKALTFLREPVNRTISHYQHVHRLDVLTGHVLRDAEIRKIKNMSLEEFISNTEMKMARSVENAQTLLLGGFENGFQKPPKEKNLEIAQNRLAQAAFFGITERFQDSLYLMSFIFGWPPFKDQLSLNRAPEISLKITPKVENLIQQKVALDTQLYRYGQDLFEQRFQFMVGLLLDRYGSDTQNKLNRPLPANVMVELLQRNYEDRRNRRNQTLLKNHVSAAYVFTPDSYMEGAFGWYPLDTLVNFGAVRWSGPGTESGFDLPCPRGWNIQVTFRVVMVLQIAIINELSLQVNEHPIALQLVRDEQGTYIFTGDIPNQAIAGPFLRLVFSVPYTVAPKDATPDNKDARPLGFLLNWVKLKSQ